MGTRKECLKLSDFRKAIKTLEFDKITDLLSGCAHTEGAKIMAKQLVPETDIVRVKRMQDETAAAKYLIAKKKFPALRSGQGHRRRGRKSRQKLHAFPVRAARYCGSTSHLTFAS